MNWSASIARAVLPSQLSGRFVKLEQTHSFSVHVISWQPVQVRDGWSAASVYLQSHAIPHFRSCPLSKVENVKLVQWIGSTSQLGVQCRCNRHNSYNWQDCQWALLKDCIPKCMPGWNGLLGQVRWNKREPSGSVSYSEYFTNCSNSLIWKWTIIFERDFKSYLANFMNGFLHLTER